MSVVVLSPHLDDAVLSAFDVLTERHVDEDLAVVNVYTGAPLKAGSLSIWDKVCGFDDSFDVCFRRLAEDAHALGFVGVERAECLGLRDAAIRRADSAGHPDDLPVYVRSQLLDAFDRLGSERPTVYAPLGGGPKPHPDHVLVRDAAVDFHRKGLARVILYADQPYVYKNRAWPEWIRRNGDLVPEEPRWWSRFPRAVPEMVSLTETIEVVLVDAEAKLAAMKLYETQYENLNEKLRTKGLLTDPALYGVEVYWRLA